MPGSGEAFTPEEIAHCRAAMAKPAPLQALRLIASGRVIVEVSEDGRQVLLDECDGERIRDTDRPGHKMVLAGAWPLYRAGVIDRFGIVTPEGRASLSQNEERDR